MQGAPRLNCCWCESNTLHWRIATASHLGQEENAILRASCPTPSTLVERQVQKITCTCTTHNAPAKVQMWMHTRRQVNTNAAYTHTHKSPMTLIFIRFTVVGMLTDSAASVGSKCVYYQRITQAWGLYSDRP